MIPVLYYLLKVTICSAVLFSYYHIALRNKLFHHWNRFYLLIVVTASLLIPILHFTVLHPAHQSKAIQLLQVVTTADEFVVEASGKSNPFTFEQSVFLLYAFVSLLLLSGFLLTLQKIYTLLKNNPVQQINDIRFVDTEAREAPFSFLQIIFWNKNIDLHSEPGQLIFKHELVHIQEKHTWDKLFLQLVLILFWCNPVFWLIRYELKMIHEFIADKKSVHQHGTAAFATMILQSAYGSHYHQITNSFFQSPIKRRLLMLTKIQSPRFRYLSRIFVLPLVALVAVAFTLKTKAVSHSNAYSYLFDKPITVVIDAGHGGRDNGVEGNGKFEKDIALTIAQKIKQQNTNDKIHIVLTRDNDELPDLHDRVKIAADNKADVFISIHVNGSGPGMPDNSGMEVFVPSKEPPYQQQSEILGSVLINELNTTYNTVQQLKKSATGVWVIDHNVCPAVLIECGYLTNQKDYNFIKQEGNQEQIAAKILEAIERYAASNTSSQVTSKAADYTNPGDTIPKQYYRGKEVSGVEVQSRTNQVTLTYADGKTETISLAEAKKQKLLLPPPPPPSVMPPPPPPAEPTVVPPSFSQDAKGNSTMEIKTISLQEAKAYKNLPVVLDGKIINGTIDNIAIAEDKIQSVSVGIGNFLIEGLGSKAKEGMILISTKEYSEKQERERTAESRPVFTQVEQEGAFPGGTQAWREYLQKNLNASTPVEHGAPAGTYTVQIQFKIDQNGKLSQLDTLTHHGYGMEAEVMRFMQSSPDWIPAEQNGKPVASIHKQPITFVIAEE